jgi:hypothetical protein
MVEGIDTARDRFGVLVDDQVHAAFTRHTLAHLVHRPELPRRVDVQQREGRLGRVKGLLRQPQHHRRVLADGIEHHRPLALGDNLAEDLDALGFETLQMGEHGSGQRASRSLGVG